MSNGGFYEEVIVFKDLKSERDSNEYYISEEFSEMDKINFVLKKGTNLQKEAIISNIPNIVNNYEILNNTVTYIIENIEIWDQCLSFAFADSLSKVIEKITYLRREKFYEIFINNVIKFLIKTITTEDKLLSDEYVSSFNEITEILGQSYRIDLENDIVENTTSLGSFGKPAAMRRFSVYFCASLIKISNFKSYNEDLLKRFLILTSDSDISVRMEAACQTRIVLKELDEYLIKKHFHKIIDNYLNDNDLIVKSEIIVSVLLNFDKITDLEFINNFNQKIHKLFESEYPQSDKFKCIIKIFDTIVKQLYDNVTNHKNFINLIKLYLKKFFINYDKDENYNKQTYSYENIIENLNMISIILKTNGENNFWIDFFTFLVKQIFENNSHDITQDSFSHTKVYSLHADYKILFYENIHKIVEVTSRQLFNRHISTHLFSHFQEGEKSIVIIIFKHFDKILQYQKINENDEFFNQVSTNFHLIEENYLHIKDWRVQKEVLIAFFNSFECFYKNSEKVDDNAKKLISFILKNISFENYQIQCEAAKLLAKNLKYSRNRENILKIAESELLQSKSFYKKRLYFTFFDMCCELFSIKLLKEFGIVDNLLKYFDDNYLILTKLINSLQKFYPLISDDSRLKFVIMNKIEMIRKNINSKVIIDKEVVNAMKNFDTWYNNYIKEGNESLIYKEMLIQDKYKTDEENKQKEKDLYGLNVINTESRDKRLEEYRRGSKKLTLKKTSIGLNLGSNPNQNYYSYNSSNHSSNTLSYQKKLSLKNSSGDVTSVMSETQSPNLPLINKNPIKKRNTLKEKDETRVRSLRRNSYVTPELKSLKNNRDISIDKPPLSQSVNVNFLNYNNSIFNVNTNKDSNMGTSININFTKKHVSSKEVKFISKNSDNSINTTSQIVPNFNTPISIFKSPNSQIHIPIKMDYNSLNSPRNSLNFTFNKNEAQSSIFQHKPKKILKK